MDFKEVCEHENSDLNLTDYIFYVYLISISIVILVLHLKKSLKNKIKAYINEIFYIKENSQKAKNNDKEKVQIIDDEKQNQFNCYTNITKNNQEEIKSRTNINKGSKNKRGKKNKNKNKNINNSNQKSKNNQNISQNHNNNINNNQINTENINQINNEIYNEINNQINNENNYQINNENNNQINSVYNNDNGNNELGFIIMNIENEPQIGLTNIGATCYMNATLQCFSHTIKLTNYHLAPKNKNYVTRLRS